MRMLNIRQVNKHRMIVRIKKLSPVKQQKSGPNIKKTFCLVPESLTRIQGSTLSLSSLAN
jgi:hypothetical protein